MTEMAVILQGDRLYYYEHEYCKGNERGCGIIELKYFASCVEAPLTDHKKATNVFLLIASQRGFFDQVRFCENQVQDNGNKPREI